MTPDTRISVVQAQEVLAHHVSCDAYEGTPYHTYPCRHCGGSYTAHCTRIVLSAALASRDEARQEREYRVRWHFGGAESSTLPTREHAEQMIAKYNGDVTGDILWRYKATEWQVEVDHALCCG